MTEMARKVSRIATVVKSLWVLALCALPLSAMAEDLGAAQDAGPSPQDAGADAVRERPAWAPRLRATVKPASAHVGDPIRLEIVATYQQGVSVNLPVQLELGPFSELSRRQKSKTEGPEGHVPQVVQTFALEVAAYQLGELTLPGIEVNALGPGGELLTMHTSPVPIRIGSVMANEPNPKLKQAEPPVQVFQRTWWLLYLLGGILAAAAVALITLLLYRRVQARKRAGKPPPPPIPAHILAIERLDQIDVDQLISRRAYKQLYLQLSEILREYIGRTWHFDALEMTTAEISEYLARHEVHSEVRQRLRRYFDECDLVKFAKVLPEDEDARGAVRGARELVHDTAPRPATAVETTTAARVSSEEQPGS